MKILFIIGQLVLLSACSYKKTPLSVITGANAGDTLSYTYKGSNPSIDSCRNAEGCSYTAASYPVFASDSLLNDTVQQTVLDHLTGNGTDDTTRGRSLAQRIDNL